MNKLYRYILPVIITIAAISISFSAAYYSVTGLSLLFAGAQQEVIIMAATLEATKLIIATLLHQYWKRLSKALKYYFILAVTVLVLITSMGIYGFLSGAYQETSDKNDYIGNKISNFEDILENNKLKIGNKNVELKQVNKAINNLREGIVNNKVQYTNKQGKIVTTTSSSNRESLENQLKIAIKDRGSVKLKIDSFRKRNIIIRDSIHSLQSSSNMKRELGPLRYISYISGIDMDMVVNYLILSLIFVFDPLAIALVIAANLTFNKVRRDANNKNNDVWDDVLENSNLSNEDKYKKEKDAIKNKTWGPYKKHKKLKEIEDKYKK